MAVHTKDEWWIAETFSLNTGRRRFSFFYLFIIVCVCSDVMYLSEIFSCLNVDVDEKVFFSRFASYKREEQTFFSWDMDKKNCIVEFVRK